MLHVGQGRQILDAALGRRFYVVFATVEATFLSATAEKVPTGRVARLVAKPSTAHVA